MHPRRFIAAVLLVLEPAGGQLGGQRVARFLLSQLSRIVRPVGLALS